jgi:hypothetical protein
LLPGLARQGCDAFIIVRQSKVLSGLVDTFEADWSAKETIESGHAAGRAARAQEEP